MTQVDTLEEFGIFEVTPDPDELTKKNKKQDDSGSVSIRELYRYASILDLVLVFLGIFGAIACGVLQPMMMLVMGDMMDSFGSAGTGGTMGGGADLSMIPPGYSDPVMTQSVLDMIQDTVDDLVFKMIMFSLGQSVGMFIMQFCFFVVSQRQGIKIRILYFRALLRQDAGWYDFQESGELTSRIASDVQEVQDGMSQKFGMIFQIVCGFVAGYAIGFSKIWDLALIVLASGPLLFMDMMFLGITARKLTEKGETANGEAGAIAESTLGNVRTVHSLGQEHEFTVEYHGKMDNICKYHVGRAFVIGIGLGIMQFLIFGVFGLGCWYGSLVIRGKGQVKGATAGDVMIVFMSVLMATMNLAMVAMPINALSTARAAAYRIYQTIDRIPDIDTKSTRGDKPTICEGNIKLDDVQFRYPTRPTKQILGGLDLEIKKGQTVALVGASGCGKSTTIQLIQRVYDVVGGKVTLDGKDLRELNLRWLRNQIGVVGQEPVLFAGTIRENIMLGARDDQKPTEEEMIECAKMANAHEFISHLPDKYDTLVGEKGAQMSGGQKQRIAIARALIRNPTILLLDEATSALDTQSEKIVQQALEKASQGRTTIIVAHRLTTVKNANRICVFHQGEIIEQGTHDELMELKGTYYTLVRRQSMEDEVDQEQVEEDLKKFREQEDKDAEMGILRREGSMTLEGPGIVEQLTKEYDDEMAALKKSNKGLLFRVLLDNFKHETLFTIIGILGGIAAGAIMPFYMIHFMEIMITMLSMSPTVEATQEQLDDMVEGSCLILVFGAALAITSFCYLGIFLASGEKFIARMRKALYKALIRQNVSYFDRKENMVGKVTTRLASDPTSIKGITGERIGNVVNTLSSIGFGVGIALYFDWKTSLCVIAVAPIFIILTILNGKLNRQQTSPATKAYEKSGITLVEAVEAIKTVQMIGKEDVFYEKYRHALRKPRRNIMKWGPLLSFVQSLNTFISSCIGGYSMYVGTVLLRKNCDVNQPLLGFFEDFMDRFSSMQKAMMCVMMAAMSIGNLGSMVPDVGKAMTATKNTFDVFDRKPPIDISSESGDVFKDVNGVVEFKDVCFRYPTRPDNSVLKGISFKVEKGKTVALVGASGCGKSTSIQLIERFYDPTYGTITLDGRDIKGLNLHFLRSQIGLVGQEPVLFAGSVMDNIRRGVPKGMDVSNEQVYQVCKMANAHDFISSLPEGYNTLVGDRGSQMSGGQKQRIAIARALIRNPKVLLLDEATSALDSESEKIVQDALDKAAQGRTTIVIAHRLSTIQNADQICVIMRGKIAERGTHEELLEMKGFYYTLAMQQFGTV